MLQQISKSFITACFQDFIYLNGERTDIIVVPMHACKGSDVIFWPFQVVYWFLVLLTLKRACGLADFIIISLLLQAVDWLLVFTLQN